MKISLIICPLRQQPCGNGGVITMLANEMAIRGHAIEILVSDTEEYSPPFPLGDEVQLHYMGDLALNRERVKTLNHLKESGVEVIVIIYGSHDMLFASQMLIDSSIPYLISELDTPETIISRWNQEERLAAMSAADRIHMLVSEFIDSLPEPVRERVTVIPDAVTAAGNYGDSDLQQEKAAIDKCDVFTAQKVFDQWEELLKETASIKETKAQSHIDPYSADAKWRAKFLRLANRKQPTLPADPQRKNDCPRVSVIVPVYNVSNYLFECLDSVCNQTLKDIEIICIDDASTDNSAELLENFRNNDSRIIIRKHERNRGLAAARNTGMEVARGDFIYFLDSDDFLARDDSLEILYIAAIEDSAEIAIGGVMRWNAQTGNQGPGWHEKYMRGEVRGQPLEQLPQLTNNVVAWNKMLRRDFLLSNDIGFDEALRKHEDDPFSCKAHILARRISIRPVPTYIYRQGRTESIMANLTKEDALYEAETCCRIFKFIESKPDYSHHRKHFYRMYSTRLIYSVERLSRFSPSPEEKDRLWGILQTVVSHLPNHLPNIHRSKKRILREIQQGKRTSAWNSAIKFSHNRLYSLKSKFITKVVRQFRSSS